VATPNPLDRPAFYALRPGGWRDLLTVLHPPYTAWHLSYVAFGAVAAPELHGDRLAATLLAFFLAVGIAAHAFDELNGRPLRTQLSDGVLFVMGALALAGAVATGIVGAVTVSLGLLAFIAVGAFIVVAYNFELFGGRFHSDFWFAAAWGAFPALTGYWINALQFRLQGVLVAAACFALSLAQRGLSTRVRELRRRTVYVSGEQRLADGTTIELDAARLAAPFDDALRACAVGLTLLATGLVIARL
jgi:ABC-type branched-subunit amino acid transport system permease subunit